MASFHLLAPLNSLLNSLAAILLACGFYCIRRKWVRAHRRFMLSALATSALFLCSYSIYHYEVGEVRFQGQGWVRPLYFSVLTSHVVLAAVIVPLALITVTRAMRGNIARHRRIARWTLPIWLYVSITGVIVYLMCYRLYAPGYTRATSSAGAALATHQAGLAAARPAPKLPQSVKIPSS